jgi:hypothetical protein
MLSDYTLTSVSTMSDHVDTAGDVSSDLVSTPPLMLPPPPRQYCAFGSSCSSPDGGREKGREICSRCKNMSYDDLHGQATNTVNDRHHLERLVEEYFLQLKKECDERIAKNWGFPCACKDPDYKQVYWRRHFDPEDWGPCGSVPNRGQLCKRCYTKAREQQCSFLIDFDGDRQGFPCIWEDPRFDRAQDRNWKQGPLDREGKQDPNWEKDPRKHPNCLRPLRSNRVCQRCYNRMCEIRRFDKYFERNSGTLHEVWR